MIYLRCPDIIGCTRHGLDSFGSYDELALGVDEVWVAAAEGVGVVNCHRDSSSCTPMQIHALIIAIAHGLVADFRRLVDVLDWLTIIAHFGKM